MTKERSEISHIVQKAEEYLKKFDNRELVMTPEAGKKEILIQRSCYKIYRCLR